jgi:hypothetical protein
MKKLWDELESHRTNGEIDVIIKYIRGTPTIVTKDNRSNARVGNFFIVNIFYQNVCGLLTKIHFFT